MSTAGPYGTDRLRVPNPRQSPRRRSPARTYSRLIPPIEELMSPVFVAVDFETANRRGGVSACQVALIKVQENQVIGREVTYICPPPGYDRFEFTWLHGISAKQTQSAPQWDEVAERLDAFVDGAPVFAHNASFDARVWRELDSHFGTISIPQKFYCSYRLAQRVVPGLPNYKLPTVTKACAPQFQLEHHRADSDAEACAQVVSSIRLMDGIDSLLS